ncbi:BglG family transcription antiterminator [Streptococcus iniae]|uniref:PRD domain-containing protein n=2 Tax=Streptococcus iniae TaxID=1346 RepID=A0A3L8GI98_STRIN|nr:PRD domain-containing protein [Streptococcus iniae]AGM99171.1 BglG family transcription antiterminator, PTS system IIA component [Streptococcus iniae SF1]AHY16110.1 transcription antiterminator BglG [Streptococcus iniae]AHY17973.1 transcription antiterminator BglG [Streptococcus iniae]APD32144.1 transcription antiterminator BglG [Streptococcus iniae]ASL35098.1 BglG family transcription antiterminator, PTS system IIA component [Streptococcus iniae]
MLSKKEMAIVAFLLSRERSYVSSGTLANELGSSDRTIRKYLKNIIAILPEYGARINSKQGYGYCMTIERPMEFDMFWQETIRTKKRLDDVTQLEEAVDREYYLLNKLCFEDAVQDFASLCQELYISQTTLKTVLSDIKKQLALYGISLTSNSKCVQLQGKEADIRHFIMDYFFVNSFNESMYAMVENSFLDDVNFAEITIFVLDACRDAKLKLSDFVMHNLVLHIALMVQRIHSGNQLEGFPISEDIQESIEYQVALNILNRVEEAMGIHFPKEEANYIALHLKVKHSVSDAVLACGHEDSLSRHLRQCIEKAAWQTGMKFQGDHQLLNGLRAHMLPLTTRLENKIPLTNPLTNDVKSNYPEVFALTKSAFSQMPELASYQVCDDEWAYIALHVLAAIERYSNRNKLRVLVVCATGYGSAMMLKNRLEKEFKGRLKIVDVVSYYEISEKALHTIDLIISSISLSQMLFLTPVITVSVLLSEQNIEEIRQFIGDKERLVKDDISLNKMTLKEAEKIAKAVFKEKAVLYFEEPLTKEQALKTMIHCLEEASHANFIQDFQEQVKLRESYSSIVYGDVLAFPHPASPRTYTEQVVVAVCKDPIYWDKDHQEVRFIFLLSPSKGTNGHLKYISPSLVSFVNAPKLQKQFMQEPTYQHLITLFTTIMTEL